MLFTSVTKEKEDKNGKSQEKNVPVEKRFIKNFIKYQKVKMKKLIFILKEKRVHFRNYW